MMVKQHCSFHTSHIHHNNNIIRQQEKPQQQENQTIEETVDIVDDDDDSKKQSLIRSKLKAYSELMRLDKPIGTYLLLYPCLWSMAFADTFSLIPDPATAIAFSIGALVMRGAGCTVNDIWDRKIDAQVERTKDRPIASGRVSVPEAIAFLGAQLSVGAWILFSQFNVETILACTGSLALVALYPLMKRITNWPQAFLGLTFNWGALVGFLAISGATFYNPMVTVPLYLAGVSWTLVYDTIYAHQDKEDDRTVGVKSTALHFGDGKRGRMILTAFAVLFGLLMIVAGYVGARFDPIDQMSYYLAVLLSTAFLLNMIHTVDLNNAAQCGQKFRANRFVGLVILFGIIGANFSKRVQAMRFEREREALIKQGYDPQLVPVDEELKTASQMYKQLDESKKMSISEKLTLAWKKLGF